MKRFILPIIIFNIITFSIVRGQTILAVHSENDAHFPKLLWYSINIKDTTDFSVYRTGLEKTDFKPVHTIQRSYMKGDTLFFRVIDTTLTKKALYKYFIALPYNKDSVIRSEVLYGHNMGNMPSPQIVHFKATPSDEKKAILLSWKLNYNFTVNTLSIYRSTNYEAGYELIAQLSGDAESYTDRVNVANEAYFYFFVIHDYFGYQMPSIRFHGIATYKEKPFSPQNAKLTADNNSVKLSWTRMGNNIIGYRIYRQVNNSGKFVQINNMFYTPDKEVSYTDSTISQFSNKNVNYYIVSVSDGFVESNPSDTLHYRLQEDIVKTAPKECDYVIDSLNRVMLIWTSQEADEEVKGYNVYRFQTGGEKEKLNNRLIPFNVNYYTDVNNNGRTAYNYEIETISITNTPSLNKTTVNVGKHYVPAHLILSLKRTDKGITIEAIPLTENGIKEILLFKQVNSGSPAQLAKMSPDTIRFTDTNVKSGELYSYSAVAVYKDNSEEIVNAGVIMRY
jgi:hypothetical protein